jgi:hypothetical protein
VTGGSFRDSTADVKKRDGQKPQRERDLTGDQGLTDAD